MIQQGPDGFTVNFEPLAQKPNPSDDERLLLAFHDALAPSASQPDRGEAGLCEMDLSAHSATRLAETLQQLEAASARTAGQEWSPDVLELSRNLRERLLAIG